MRLHYRAGLGCQGLYIYWAGHPFTYMTKLTWCRCEALRMLNGSWVSFHVVISVAKLSVVCEGPVQVCLSYLKVTIICRYIFCGFGNFCLLLVLNFAMYRLTYRRRGGNRIYILPEAVYYAARGSRVETE